MSKAGARQGGWEEGEVGIMIRKVELRSPGRRGGGGGKEEVGGIKIF
jgi:hypothetical protein